MGIYSDYTLYCDLCHVESCTSGSTISDCRKEAAKRGWRRKRLAAGEWVDVCYECRNKEREE